MYDQQQHEMELEIAHPSGAEEWVCHICGRRFLMQWPPEYKKIVLEPGDEYAYHSGAKGGLQMMPPEPTQDEDPTVQREQDFAVSELSDSDSRESDELADELRPWLKWLKDADLGDHLNEAA
jgi:hypothetical protein